MSERKWRFAPALFSDDNGANIPGFETFKRDPTASLAREICQNSLDAANENLKKAVQVVFEEFSMPVSSVPGCEELKHQLDLCLEKNKTNEETKKDIVSMIEALKQPNIRCLRISDYNTTGLTDIESNNPDGKWHSLTHKIGGSPKGQGKLGSKGLGKYASFVVSSIRTVIYSSYNIDGERGWEGVSRLPAANIDGSDDWTQGAGYFAEDEKNTAIRETIELGGVLPREGQDYGTDIYILGFDSGDNWRDEVLCKILDSFMVAIFKETLAIDVGGIKIASKKDLNAVFGQIKFASDEVKRSIIAQFDLLCGAPEICEEHITIGEFGKATVLVKKYGKEDQQNATKQCVYVRYPWMKIKQITCSAFPCSGMCILDDCKLADLLRDIENPEHKDWEPNREKDPQKQKSIRSMIRELYQTVDNVIDNFIGTSNKNETDFGGASDYLPMEPDSLGDTPQNGVPDSAQVSKPVFSKTEDKTGYDNSEPGDSFVPDIGDVGEGGDGVAHPLGQNGGGGGENHPGEGEGHKIDGDKEIFERVAISGFHFRFAVLDKANGVYQISFLSRADETNCDLAIRAVDDSGGKTPVAIKKASINGKDIIPVDNEIKGISLALGERMKIKVVLDKNELFAAEVKLYANRK